MDDVYVFPCGGSAMPNVVGLEHCGTTRRARNPDIVERSRWIQWFPRTWSEQQPDSLATAEGGLELVAEEDGDEVVMVFKDWNMSEDAIGRDGKGGKALQFGIRHNLVPRCRVSVVRL